MSFRSPLCLSRPPLAAALLAGCAAGLLGCGGGGSNGGNGSQDPGNPAPGGVVTISGVAQYEYAPPAQVCSDGLDFNSIELRPIRRATLQVLNADSQAVLAETVTGENGEYELTVDAGSEIFLRVRAELKLAGSPSWDVEVRNNVTGDPATTPPLYVLDGAVFDPGDVDVTRDITAATGWGGSSYTGPRSAAPFSVLDAIYRGMLLVLAEEPTVSLEPLDVFWSADNTAAQGETWDGDIGTSFYRSDNSLFLLGMEGVDTEEFDHHVIAHEWGHYFEDTLSRTDSIGGAHSLGDRLDMRVAFSEGWATALAGIALESPDYCDTGWSGDRQAGFRINIEGQAAGERGWYNEISVMELIYDLWDTDLDGVDTDSIGFGPIYDVMTGPQATTPAFTSIFTFAEALKAANPAAGPFIDALLTAENITASDINAYGDGEMNGAGGAPDVLPIYTEIVPNGSTLNICSNSQFDRSSGDALTADGNKLSEHRYLRMTIDNAARYTFAITTTTAMPAPDDPEDDRDQSDPDILILLNGVRQNSVVGDDRQGFSGAANEEIFTTANVLQPGEYVMALVEFRYQDDESPADFPDRTCFDVSVAPN